MGIDVSTITAHAYRRIMKEDAMPGVFEVSCDAWMRGAVDDILLLTECSSQAKGKAKFGTCRSGRSIGRRGGYSAT